VSRVKTAELIKMPFGLWARMGPGNHVLDAGREVQTDVAMEANFGSQFAINGFMCMIATRRFIMEGV